MSYQNRTITPNKKARTPVKSPLYETPSRSISNPKKIEHNVSRLSTTAETQGRSNKFERQMEHMQKQLTNNRDKLCSCLQIYAMLESNAQNQRCLLHNNTLSLYCLNQRRILCVNCLYGMHRHRSHKVIPLKDCMEQVYDDNMRLRTIIEEQIKKLDYYSKMAQENTLVLQTQMRRILLDMEQEYAAKIDEIKAKFEKSKQLVKDSFTPLIERCQKVKISFEDFRFNVWKAFTMYCDQKQTDDNEIMKQLLFVTIVELCEFRNRTITKTQLDSLSRKTKYHF